MDKNRKDETVKKPLGIILYEGPSLFDGKPIIVVATGFRRSRNKKTGKMIQVWIIRPDVSPLDASANGEDYSICGTCKHRHFRSCYVNIGLAPSYIYQSYTQGKYLRYTTEMLDLFRNRKIRLGAYGDPAAVPISIWQLLCGVSSGWTGYTHSWKRCTPELKQYCMASVDTEKEYHEAQSRGWRTFRIREEKETVLDDEFICPASKEAGHKITCDTCQGCKGLSENKLWSPVIIFHGPSWKKLYYGRGMKKMRNHKKYVRN